MQLSQSLFHFFAVLTIANRSRTAICNAAISPKKSRLKTYRRFSCFRRICHDFRVKMENCSINDAAPALPAASREWRGASPYRRQITPKQGQTRLHKPLPEKPIPGRPAAARPAYSQPAVALPKPNRGKTSRHKPTFAFAGFLRLFLFAAKSIQGVAALPPSRRQKDWGLAPRLRLNAIECGRTRHFEKKIRTCVMRPKCFRPFLARAPNSASHCQVYYKARNGSASPRRGRAGAGD
jgi:hypothetical protein